MAEGKRLRDIIYWVCCDCRLCCKESGMIFDWLSGGFDTEQQAKREVGKYLAKHPFCFVAKGLIESVDQEPRTQKRPARILQLVPLLTTQEQGV